MKIVQSVLADYSTNATIDTGWKIPSLADVLSFAIRTFFIIAGVAALLYLVLGAFAWVTSGGEKEKVSKAQEKIQAAIVGLIILVGVIAIILTIEQVIFNQKICLGLSCPIQFQKLLQ